MTLEGPEKRGKLLVSMGILTAIAVVGGLVMMAITA